MTTTTATVTAHELAHLLLTYPDLPVRLSAIGVEHGDEVTQINADDRVRLEIHTDWHGNRKVAVLANYDEM